MFYAALKVLENTGEKRADFDKHQLSKMFYYYKSGKFQPRQCHFIETGVSRFLLSLRKGARKTSKLNMSALFFS